jgi:hypothetical protein
MNNAADEYDVARPGLGDDFLSAIDGAVTLILAAPDRWPRADNRHHRFVLRRFPFSFFYRFNDTEIVVVALAHQKRRPGYWSRRR